ncbi:MAG: site-specific DNA-methyltransferase, partial [Clostridia bacterium]
MAIGDLKARLCDVRDFQKKTEAEKDALIAYWEHWQDKPTATIIKASDLSEEEQRQFIIKDNVGYGEWDMDMLANEWEAEDLEDWGLDVWQDKGGEDGDGESSKPENGSLVDRFVIPPFSILDTRRGYWQARKKTWRELIGDMGESRNDMLITSPEIKFKDIYQKTRQHRESLGLSFKEYLDKYVSDEVKEKKASKVLLAGVSLLDPVMAELVCRWFGLENCKSFDCFAGDSVFGYVSAHLGNEFTGIEIREEQARLNNKRVEGMSARYINDDGQNVAQHIAAGSQDLLFSCPPYYDLEVYSDLETDASNQETYEDFLAILTNAFKAALGCLKEDRFAVIVVGDVRDKKTGFYYNFVDDMKRIFKENGAALYNELILIETCASTAMRAARYMESRKVAK